MVIKVYISGISGNKEVKKRQQRVLLILDSKNVKYEVIDIAEPGAEELKDFMQNNSTSFGGTISDPNPRHPLPPQIFNDDEYCGDYDKFDMANEIDEMEKFLKLEVSDSDANLTSNAEIKLKNGELTPEEAKPSAENTKEENETKENEVPKDEEKTESDEKEADQKVSDEAKETEDTEESVEAKNGESEEPEDDRTENEETTTEASGDKVENVEDNSKNDEEKADEA